MRKRDSAGRIDFPQMILIGVVIAVIGLFLANNAFLVVGTGISPPRTISEFCYDSDNGIFPYDEGAVIHVQLDRPIQTRLPNSQLVQYITSVSVDLDVDSMPSQHTITFQPPGVTGNAISGKLSLSIDSATGAADADDVTSESTGVDPNVQDIQAVLTEKYCIGDQFIGEKLFIGNDFEYVQDSLVQFLLAQGGNIADPAARLI